MLEMEYAEQSKVIIKKWKYYHCQKSLIPKKTTIPLSVRVVFAHPTGSPAVGVSSK